LKDKVFVYVAVLSIAIILLTALYLINVNAPNTGITGSPSSRTEPGSKLYVSNISIVRFNIIDSDLYMRIRVYGYLNLHDKVTVNNVYGFWFGFLRVTLPYGEDTLIYDPGNYVDVVKQILEVNGTRDFDVYLPLRGDKPGLDGVYNISFYLIGPYGNVSVLYQKQFNLTASSRIAIYPVNMSSWDETVNITITNTGDLPLFFSGAGLIMPETRNSLGGFEPINYTNAEIIVMPGETGSWIGKLYVFRDLRYLVAGKTVDLIMIIDFGTAKSYETVTLTFPQTISD